MRIIFKIILALLLAVNLSFAIDDYIDDYYDSWKQKTISKKFLSQGCKTISKDIWNESKVSYRQTTILNIYKEPILNLYGDYDLKIKEIQHLKNQKYKECNKNFCYDFDFKWLNNKSLLVQLHFHADKYSKSSCELWLYEEEDGSVDVYSFTSKNLPD